jgi:TRAP-type C4-dicarboxylate transport system substrate-binding protein
MNQEKVELSQMYSYVLGNYHSDFWAFDMPFMFEDHEHATAVLEGPIGEKVLSDLSEKSDIRGLAFTYSGGFKCIPTKNNIATLSDFKGQKIRTSNSPVSQDIFKSIGAEPVLGDIEDMVKEGLAGTYAGGESTYVRIQQSQQQQAFPTVVDAQHSLLLTSIITSDKFWASLDEKTKAIFKEAALNAARAERQHSVSLGEQVKQECAARDIQVVDLDAETKNAFKQSTEWLYAKYSDMFTPGLLDQMKQAR